LGGSGDFGSGLVIAPGALAENPTGGAFSPVVAAAVTMGIEDGTQLRVDTTVVQTNIQFPTDSKLLWDCVRVLTRLVERLVEQLPQLSERFHNRTRYARRRPWDGRGGRRARNALNSRLRL
jgi:IS5 family transposase